MKLKTFGSFLPELEAFWSIETLFFFIILVLLSWLDNISHTYFVSDWREINEADHDDLRILGFSILALLSCHHDWWFSHYFIAYMFYSALNIYILQKQGFPSEKIKNFYHFR